MLVDYVVTQSLPVDVKFSEDLSLFLKNSSSNPITISPENPINVASILQSVVEELKSVALSNSKLHDKLNRLNMSTSGTFASKSNAEPKNLPIINVHPKLDTARNPIDQ